MNWFVAVESVYIAGLHPHDFVTYIDASGYGPPGDASPTISRVAAATAVEEQIDHCDIWPLSAFKLLKGDGFEVAFDGDRGLVTSKKGNPRINRLISSTLAS